MSGIFKICKIFRMSFCPNRHAGACSPQQDLQDEQDLQDGQDSRDSQQVAAAQARQQEWGFWEWAFWCAAVHLFNVNRLDNNSASRYNIF